MTAQITPPLFLIACVFCSCGSIISADDWELVWKDEFDGESLNYSQRKIAVNAFGGGNHEQQITPTGPRTFVSKTAILPLKLTTITPKSREQADRFHQVKSAANAVETGNMDALKCEQNCPEV